MSAGTTVASDPAGIFAGSADGATRCYQTLPSTERCALAALRACYPDAATDRLARTAHEAVEAMMPDMPGRSSPSPPSSAKPR